MATQRLLPITTGYSFYFMSAALRVAFFSEFHQKE